jgi:hypothetical protein
MGNPTVILTIISEKGEGIRGVLDIRLFREEDCDFAHYLMVTKVRKRQTVNKQRSRRHCIEKYRELKKLNEEENKEKYRVWVSNSFGRFGR